MDILRFDPARAGGCFKPLNATNGGPWHKRHASDQYRTNFENYKAARIPYARNHDSAFGDVYGGPYAHDITCIFPDFDADADDPASYDFANTDESILVCLEAGTQTFFRLGQSIEHQIRKHGTLPPKDFRKWAVICEHIIRHYNEGWADGYRLGMTYWEIWNEPDLDPDDSPNKRTWGGTKAQFFDLYEITAKHLKACFPALRIGGPAICGNEAWAEDFLREMKRRDVPIDFFSWHIYTTQPAQMAAQAGRIRALLDKYGYEAAESILNEWNYVRGWTQDYVYSLETIHGMKGAAFLMACISTAASSPIDMLMYYDTRLSAFNGVFDFYTFRPLKGYLPMKWYGSFYDMAAVVPAVTSVPDVYPLCGCGKDGKLQAVVTCYTDDDTAGDRTLTVDFGRSGTFEVSLLDAEHDGEVVGTMKDLTFDLKPQSCVMIREI
ncbi:MAG: hypothetical protein MJ192_10140 [Clostridia bacterium]|nr:hypothetical protein [Clostridia bacterium]